MKTVSMLEFRKDAQGVIRRALRGEEMVLSYRGRPVLRLEPVDEAEAKADDPFYRLPEFAESGATLSNEEIDRVLYETT